MKVIGFNHFGVNGNVSLGYDAEGKLEDSEGNLIPAWFVFHGTKENQTENLFEVEYDSDVKLVKVMNSQHDNVMAEVSGEPVHDYERFGVYLKATLNLLRDTLFRKDLKLTHPPAFKVEDSNILQSPEAQEVGCLPDFNAYEVFEENPRPNAEVLGDWRTTGLHFHFGLPGFQELEDHEKHLNSMHISRCFDAVVYLQLMHEEPDTVRQQFYGINGGFRVKDYGVECRRLSGFFFQEEYVSRITALFPMVFEVFESNLLVDTNSALCKTLRAAAEEKCQTKAASVMSAIEAHIAKKA